MNEKDNKPNEQLKLIRVSKGYSQEQVADMLGITQASYARLEQGKSKLTLERLGQISNFFNVEIEYFTKSKEQYLDDGSISAVTNDYLKRIVQDNIYLREHVVTELKSEINFLKEQNKMLLQMIRELKQ